MLIITFAMYVWQDCTQKEYLDEHKVPMLVEYARLEAKQKVGDCLFNVTEFVSYDCRYCNNK